MSGILDNKSRVIDAILTFEGRQQLASGKFSVKYATFSDKNVVYEPDAEEGHVDPTSKIYLETFNAPYDEIIFTADDSGNIKPFRQHSTIDPVDAVLEQGSVTGSTSWMSFANGQLKSRLQTFATGSLIKRYFTETTPTFAQNFASLIDGVLTSSLDNFSYLRMLGTSEPIFEDQDFALSTGSVSFSIPNNTTTQSMKNSTSVNTIDSLFNDKKLRNVTNFKYLPPIKKVSRNSGLNKRDIGALSAANLFIGNYPPWGPVEPLSFSEVMASGSIAESLYVSSNTVFLEPTSRDNALVAQMFEISNDKVVKLDIIDYGLNHNSSQNPEMITSHVFFAGKVVVDQTGSDCFVHLFTLIFSSMIEGE